VTVVWNETKGELEQDLGETSGSAPTDDPNATIPHLSFKSHEPAAGGTVTAASVVQRYRILGPLGEGGMGIVYRAEDTRLRRKVALKTVPAALIANARAKERFLNEARAASALDHPNVCTVYEIEETGAGQLYLTMPCYDGETLRSRLERGPLALLEAVQIARQAARGLAKAHQLGIVHCDVKPANLMLTGDGIVKILDFGIARLSGQAPRVRVGPSGTPRYRSPEQRRGGEVGAPSDVWSLGVVLYEMVSGQPPPVGEETASARMLEAVPAELYSVLSRMLAPRSEHRYPNAASLLLDLDRLEGRLRPASPLPARRRQTLLAAGLGIGGLCLILLTGISIHGGRHSEKPPVSVSPAATGQLTQLTDLPGKASFPSLSPDGGTVLYVRAAGGRSHIFSQPPVRDAGAIDLSADSPADDTQPSFSPDGRQIAFRSERDGGGLFLMPARGGAARRLTHSGFNPSWSPDGREVVFGTANIANPQMRRTESEVFRIDVLTGARWRVTRGDAAQPSWSPHGRRIAYWGLVPQTGQRLIWTVPAGGGEAVPVVDDRFLNWNPVWSPDGRYLYFASDRSGIMNLWRVPVDEGSGRVTGKPEPVTASQQAGMLPSLSRDGRQIVFAGDGSRATLEKLGFDPATGAVSGPAVAIVRTSGTILECFASGDGQWLAYQLLTPREDLFLVHPDGSGWRRLLGDEHKNRLPQFSPDSSRLAFYSNRSGKYEIWTLGVNGKGLAQETSIPGKLVTTPLWSPRGDRLACGVDDRAALIDLTKPLGERLPQYLPLPERGVDFIAYSWSDDGRWLAGVGQRRGGSHEPGILLYSLAAGSYVRLTKTGDGPVWLHDSRRLLYYEGESIRLLDARTGTSRPVLSPSEGSAYNDLSLSPDDRVLYLARTIEEGHIWRLKL
jgi:serine/threonine protein kinase/WD40 repeat protein